jgi:AP-3 complex subunit mu
MDFRLDRGADDGVADPLLGFAFLQTFIDIFQEYFGGISLAIVKENFDVVYQV